MAEYRLSNGETIYVDHDLLPQLLGKRWHRGLNGVVKRSYRDPLTGVPTAVTLNEVVGGKPPPGMVWTHADGDWRNFQRENLLLKPRGAHHPKTFGAMSREDLQAMARESGARERSRRGRKNGLGFRGISATGNKFRAMATVNGKQTYLGLFDTREDAARAYDQALIRQGLEPVNFPPR